MSELELEKGLKLTLNEELKTAVKHLFEERYDTWWRFNHLVWNPVELALMFKMISLNCIVYSYWAINFWFSARYVKNCAFNIFILTRVPTSIEGPQ